MDCVVHWLELHSGMCALYCTMVGIRLGDVWNVLYTGWKYIRGCVDCDVHWLELDYVMGGLCCTLVGTRLGDVWTVLYTGWN